MQVRRAVSSDAAFIADVYRPFVEDGWASFEQVAPLPTEIMTRLDKARDIYPWLIAEQDGERLGYAYAGPHRSREAYQTSVDVTIYMHPSARGKGMAKPLYQTLLDQLTAQNFTMAFAGIALPNEASIALHRAVGFKLIGRYPNVGFKASEWRDTEWWGRALAPVQTPPARLRHLSEITG